MAPISLQAPVAEALLVQDAGAVKLSAPVETIKEQLHKAVHDQTYAVKQTEMHAKNKSRTVTFKDFYGTQPTRVDRKFNVTLADHSYLPKVDNPRADWVVCAATNAFNAFQNGELGQVKRFATVGTGSGTDVIVALDVFPELEAVALTDLHEDVVATAKSNALGATEKSEDSIRNIAETAVARAGDVLIPLKGEKPYDLIYENLPNIPLPNSADLLNGQASATYVGDRTADKVPPFASAALLDLHYVALRQAKLFNLLSPSGAILSSMGGRVEIETMLKLAETAGFTGRVVSLSWKEQSEPENVIGGYAEFEKNGLGPFWFYPVSALEKVFASYKPASAALCHQQISNKLSQHRLNAVTAIQKHREGVRIGHTVVVMGSVLKGE